MTNRVWVLGAEDPEMTAIEPLLRECGEHIVYALDKHGERVTPATAYRCPVPEVPAGSTVYAVECIDTLPDGWARIDHHRPGDPGYGRPPAEFMAASSLGQVCAVLGCAILFAHRDDACRELSEEEGAHGWHYAWSGLGQPLSTTGEPFGPPVRPGANRWTTGKYGLWPGMPLPDGRDFSLDPGEAMLTAAADHCLGAAYRGECPGVDPDALMRWRVEQRATHQGRSAEQILADIERARETLSEADTVELAPGVRVVDVRGYCLVTHDCGHKELLHEDYTSHISHKHGCPGSRDLWCNGWTVKPGVPELPDAAARDGVAYLATVATGGRQKVVLGGCTTPETVRAFLEHWAPRQGLVDLYGDPARGFAGGFLP